MSAVLAERYAARVPAALRRAEAGDAVVGIVGRDVPAVLVAAAGGVPFRIPAEEADTAEAAEYLGGAVDRAALLVAAAMLAGRYDALRGVLVAHDSEASVRLAAALHELHRRGRIRVPVLLVDQVHLPRESTLRFNTGRLLGMVETVEGWTGSSITAASLAAAWDGRSATVAALRRIRDARSAPDGPTGTAALHAYGVTAAGEDAGVDADGALDAREAAALPVWLTGSAPISDRLYRLVESAGAVIVGEDHDWGDPVASDDPGDVVPRTREEAALAAASARLHGDPASATSSMAARAAATAAGVGRTGARALLAVVRDHDDGPLWDWSRQRAAAGVPAVLVRGDDPAAVLDGLETLRRSA
ncbi:2-hydroxyacyl-CoA dehydratase family protein [Amnibacterium kyonggiense]|uniref:2-hydroxyglutaryl-CoA dehydratase D-component n=1 Tax=Amnibacterium kyonggiense TaxID=595671 RepID=A0A4R7FGG3_9MICO|nr:2-hydroxyacyl-CoA dehydratase family protein [Amnibacterium kyonggiense]TDS74462.1 hypothetical protein CLV52_3644 [Amnibacterium kyonggiense]